MKHFLTLLLLAGLVVMVAAAVEVTVNNGTTAGVSLSSGTGAVTAEADGTLSVAVSLRLLTNSIFYWDNKTISGGFLGDPGGTGVLVMSADAGGFTNLPLTGLQSGGAAAGQTMVYNGTNWVKTNFPAGGGSGTVASVGGPSDFTWANSTTTPTATWNSVAANSIHGNGTGSSAAPAFSTNGDYTAHSLTAQTVTANSFNGNGVALTNLNAGNLASGNASTNALTNALVALGTTRKIFILTNMLSVSNTTTETALTNNGVGSWAIPPNSLRIGSQFHIPLKGYATSGGSHSITLNLYMGGLTGTKIWTSGAISITSQNPFWFDENLVVAALSGSVAKINCSSSRDVANGSAVNVVNASFFTIDPTAAEDLCLSVTWSSASSSDSFVAQDLLVEYTP